MRKRTLLKPILGIADFAILAGSFQLAYWMRFHLPWLPERPEPPFDLYFQFSFLVGTTGVIILQLLGLYRLHRLSFGLEEFLTVLRAVTLNCVILAAINFVFKGYITRYDVETYSRLIIIISWLLSPILLTAWRLAGSMVLKRARKRGNGLRNVVIVGTDQTARRFHNAIRENPEFEYRPLGFVAHCERVGTVGESADDILGTVADLSAIIANKHIDEVVLASTDVDNETMAQLMKICEHSDVQFSIIPGFFEIVTRQVNVHEVADFPIFRLEERIFQRWGKLAKRGMDIAISLTLLLLLSPLFAIAAILIKAGSAGPTFFTDVRVGKGEKTFHMFKFRSMRQDIEPGSVDAESRVTGLGWYLRRYSIDELPQLVNVLLGDMSLVGPRPHVVSEVQRYQNWHSRRFEVLPGITGLTQVSGRKDLTLDEMVRLDIYYIENWSPLFDVRVLLKTFPAVIQGRGAY